LDLALNQKSACMDEVVRKIPEEDRLAARARWHRRLIKTGLPFNVCASLPIGSNGLPAPSTAALHSFHVASFITKNTSANFCKRH